MQKYTFGGADAGYVGFPDDGGNGSLIFTEGFAYEFAILQSSRHKEAAWEFVRYFLTEDAQTVSYTHLSLEFRRNHRQLLAQRNL